MRPRLSIVRYSTLILLVGLISVPALLIAQLGWINDSPERFGRKRARNAVWILALFVLLVCAHAIAVDMETPDPDPNLTVFDMPEPPPSGPKALPAEPPPAPPRPEPAPR